MYRRAGVSRHHVLAFYVSADTFDSGITISLFLREGRATTGRDMAIRHQYPAFAAINLILLIATPRPLGGEVCLYGTSVS